MMDFSKKLDETSSRIREHVQQTTNAADAEKQDQRAFDRAHDKAVNESQGHAYRFMEKYVVPVMKEIQTKIPGGIRREHRNSDHRYFGESLEFRETEYLSLKVHFGEQGIELSAEASCLGEGIVYSKQSNSFAVAQFNEKDGQEWIESHALEAYEAFGQRAEAIRNPPSLVSYRSATSE
jgi:hypothetical protein